MRWHELAKRHWSLIILAHVDETISHHDITTSLLPSAIGKR